MDETLEPPKNTSLSKLLPLLAGFLILSLSANVYLFLSNRSGSDLEVRDSIQPSTPEKMWTKPSSAKKGLPILHKSGGNPTTFSLYTFDDQKTRVVGETGGHGGTSGYGDSSPHASPDLLYTAYIDKDSGDLLLLSNETLQSERITKDGNVVYISDWSPDSKKIIYYTGDPTMGEGIGDGIAGGNSAIIPYKKDIASPGFYLFDIDSGKTTNLYPIKHFEAFVDDERILVKSQYESDRFIVFNLNTFEADIGFVKETFGFGAGQFDFTKDGRNWTYTLSRNPTSDANVMYAPFPQKEGEQIDSGAWADFQWPIFSPNATKIAYPKREGYSEPGVPIYYVWVYDTATKEKTRHNVTGFIETWVDENRLVTKDSDASKTNIFLLDLTTGAVAKIF